MRHLKVFRLFAVVLAAAALSAHIGTQDVVFDGMAGPYPLRVVVRPAGVVPGLAQISVRVLAGSPTAVRVQAAPGELGSRAAPRPEAMTAVAGEQGLYSADLWLMTTGAYAVRLELEGPAGRGDLVIPVTSLATKRLGMSKPVGWALAAMALMLVAGAMTIVHGALRDAVVEAGARPGEWDRRRGRVGVTVAGVILTVVLAGGWRWWRAEDATYARTIDRPLAVAAEVTVPDGRATLKMRITEAVLDRNASSPLIPDHGKMMHLFLVREGSLDVLAHLHPAREAGREFVTTLPPLPPGRYRAYGDVVHESGLARTLTAPVVVPPGLQETEPFDVDDSWEAGSALSANPPSAGPLASTLRDGATMSWERAGSLVAGPETSIRIRVRDKSGAPAVLEPYLGMPGHAVVMRDDGRVFVHLHPAGTISIGAQERLEAVERGAGTHAAMTHVVVPNAGEPGVVSFPFAFPVPGRYRVWVQVRIGGVVQTGTFDTSVESAP